MSGISRKVKLLFNNAVLYLSTFFLKLRKEKALVFYQQLKQREALKKKTKPGEFPLREESCDVIEAGRPPFTDIL